MAQKGKHSRKRKSAGREQVSLPALSLMLDLPAFEDLPLTNSQRAAFEHTALKLSVENGVELAEYHLGCVVRLDRGFPVIACADSVFRAEYSVILSRDTSVRAAVGDWVVVRRPQTHDMGVIEALLPRTSDVARWRGNSRGEHQTLAANVGLVLIAQALSERDLDLNRIARSVVVALDCGARAAVVLTKADRCSSYAQLVSQLHTLAHIVGPEVPIIVTSAGTRPGSENSTKADCCNNETCMYRAINADKMSSAGDIPAQVSWGIESVTALVAPRTTAIVLGESGAGKSTLLNALLGREILETGAVRSSDDAGRHTTVTRRMVQIPGAGIIVDEPGLRSLPLVGHERGLALAFPEISAAAQNCKFRDCTHTHEPGCEVLTHANAGDFYPERLAAYLALASEMRLSKQTLDPDIVL
ncbi:ribosome small subunit-dependent GTPase A [Atopobium fossor]|uniref:ribosome small subunit-dependent GTPase A n=1 Tax=Atopobium fossor TaxID=39487 RepID=UPI00041C8C4A|nr:GTPase RsgA [Atopobium fossor]